MKTAVLCLSVLSYVVASPNGYYHQEYNYKTSASSYRNNELQHQTDDQGYYRKDGDLEGRVRPKVDANSEHSEYINPNLRTTDYNTGLVGGANGDLSSYGHMRANVGAYNSHDQSAESLAQSDHLAGTRGAYSGYSSGSYGASNYGSGSQSYNVASNLRTVTSRVQQELERDLQRAIQENRAYGELERELRQNLTSRLDNELVNRYGQQSIRGGLSYTLSGGRLHSTANYDNQELLDLRRNLENSLLQQLRTRYNQVNSRDRYVYSTTTHRPYYPQYVDVTSYRPFTTIRPQYPDSNYVRYTPTINQESITTIAARVQNQLDSRLNQILEDVRRTHFSSSSSYSLTNSEALLERLRNELRSNVTYFLEEEIRRNYGSQIQRDGNLYTVGTGGQTAGQHNYSVRDLESLRSQIERNLVEKLDRDFERYRTSWNQQYSQSSLSSQNSYRQYSTTPRYVVYTTPYTPRYDVYTPQYNTYDTDVEPLSNRPSSNHITSLISGAGGSNSRSQYLVAGSGQSGYEVSGSRGVSQLQRQLQQDLSSQLQAAISRGHYGYYSGSSYNPQSYQASLQQLTDELNRNLTRQLQEYSSGSYYSTYGNIDQAQLASLRSQLQADLLRQLQQGLQQSYHSSSSYSASSSSSSSSGNYRPARGFQNYQQGQYRSGGNVALLQGEDCVGDDPNAYTNHRMKRSYQPYRSQPIGLSHTGYNNYRDYDSYRNRPQQQVELGQEPDNADLTQQVEDPFGKLQSDSLHKQQLGQQVDDSDLTQQSEDLQLGQQTAYGQVGDDSDLTQQIEDNKFGKLQLGSQQIQQQTDSGQQEDNSDLTQQIEDNRFGKLQSGSHQSQLQSGQEEDNSDLTQQTVDHGFGKLQLGSQQSQPTALGQQADGSDLTQQTVGQGYGKLQVGSQPNHQQTGLGQQEDNSDLTQQTEDHGFGKLQLGSQLNRQQTGLGQYENNSNLNQQSVDHGFGKLQLGSQQSQRQTGLGQQEDDSDLTQQPVDHGFGKLELGSQPNHQQTGLGQQEDNSDLTQQTEDHGFGKLQLGSQLNRQQTGLGQYEDNSNLNQQSVDHGFGKLQLGSQQSQRQTGLGQQEDDSDLTQQPVDHGFGKLELGSQQNRQQTGLGGYEVNSDLNQQTTERGFGNLQVGSQQSQRQTGLGQQEDNSDLTQQSVDRGFGKLQLGSQQNPQQTGLGQQEDNSDLTQSVDHSFGKLQSGSQQRQQPTEFGQREDNSDLTQQVEDSGFGQLQLESQRIPRPSDGLNHDPSSQQQVENTGYGHLPFASHTQQQLRGDQQLNQIELTEHLKQELSKQVKDAIQERFYTISYSSSNSFQRQRVYQNLKDELNRNITKQLQAQYPTLSESNYIRLQKKLVRDLNFELQEKLNSISRDNLYNSGQTSQVNDFTQQNQNLEQLQENNADFTQQPENVDIPPIANDQYRNTPLFNNQQQITNQETSQATSSKIQQFQILDQLSNEIKDAVKIKYSENTGSSKLQRYQELVNDLRQNITIQLQSHGFIGEKLTELKNRFERKLKLQLEREISLNEQLSGQSLEPIANLSPNIQQQLTLEPTGANLNQQAQDYNLGSYDNDRLTQQNVDNGRLQLGNQYISQPPNPNNPLNQQINSNLETPDQSDLQQIVEQPTHQDFNRGRDNPQLTQDQLDLNHQVDYNYHPRPLEIPLDKLKFHNTRPVTRKPIDSNQFIQTELDQQHLQNPHRLPTLNQVIQQNQEHNIDNTELPSKIESLDTDLTQQVNSDQKVNGDLNIEQTTSTTDNSNPDRLTPQLSEGQATRPTYGHSQGTNQGQLFTNTQSLSDAERDNDLLIQKLREKIRNKPNPYSQQTRSYADLNVNSPSQSAIWPNQQQTFESLDFNQQQKRLVTDLKNELSINLEEAIRDYNILIHTSGTSSASLKQQLFEDLQKNITKQLQKLDKSSYVFNTFSREQQTKLYQNLKTELSTQLQTTVGESYQGTVQNNIQNGRYSPGELPGYGYGPNPIYTPYNTRVNYGQPGQIEQNSETTSDIKPLDYQLANTVQNVDPQPTAYNNIGVKGRRYHVNGNLSPQPHPSVVIPPQPPVVIPPEPQEPQLQSGVPQPVDVPSQVPDETSSIQPTGTENVTDGNLPWWKRFGHKVKQGAQNLKEKYIG